MLPFLYDVLIKDPIIDNAETSTTFATTTPINDYDDDDSEFYCLSLNNIFRTRRIFDMVASTIGILLNAIHIGILIYIKLIRKARSYELLFSQGVLAFLTHFFLLLGCLVDLCMVGINSTATWFRAHVWLFLVNAFMASYGFLIIALCIDRYVALNWPLYYRHTFVRKRTRWSLIIGSCILGVVYSLRWIPFNRVTSDNDIEENMPVTRSALYTLWRIVVYIEQYFCAGVAMLILSYANIAKLKEIKKSYKDEVLGMTGDKKAEWIRNHSTISKICAVLAISYVMFNWPYCIVDYLYTDDLNNTQWYGITTLIINLLQVVYIQLNLFFFAYCSQLYRSTLIQLCQAPYLAARQFCHNILHYIDTKRSKSIKRIEEARESTTTTTTVFTVC